MSVSKLLKLYYTILSLNTARVTGVRVEALNSTAVNVSWTPVTLLDTEYHYTVHYTTMCCSFNAIYPADASFAVLLTSGMQEQMQHQFSVTVTLNVSETIYSGRE